MKNITLKIKTAWLAFWAKNKQPLFKAVKKTIISFVALTVLIVIAGLAYTWYVGQQQSDAAEVIAVETPQKKTGSDIQSDPNANVGVSVQYLSSPITPGSETTITIKTNREAECTIAVEYNKVPSKDAALTRQMADEYGAVKWDWFVEDSVPTGTWPVNIYCYKNEKSGFVRGDLKVVKSLD